MRILRVSENGRGWLPYAEVKRIAQECGISSALEYSRLKKEKMFPWNMPSCPQQIYSEWEGWSVFLGNDYVGNMKLNIKLWPYEKAKEYVRPLGVKNKYEWRQLVREGKIPAGLAVVDIVSAYRRTHTWVSVDDFFGEDYHSEAKTHEQFVRCQMDKNKRREMLLEQRRRIVQEREVRASARRAKRNVLPFDEGHKIAMSMGIKTSREWRKAYQDGRLPEGMPKYPEHLYGGKGWSGWSHWFGRNKPINESEFQERMGAFKEMVYQSESVSGSADAKEEWKPLDELDGWDGRKGVVVSTHGRLYDVHGKRFIALCRIGGKRWHQHCGASMQEGASIGRKKMSLIHRLVARAFIPNPDNKPMVNHIDGNSSNNAVWNLEWVTPRENNYHAILTGLKRVCGLTQQQAYAVKLMLATKQYTIVQIAKHFKVNYVVVRQINMGATYKYVGIGEFTYPIVPVRGHCKADEDTRHRIKKLLSTGKSLRGVAREVGLDRNTVAAIRDDHVAKLIPKDSLRYLSDGVSMNTV